MTIFPYLMHVYIQVFQKSSLSFIRNSTTFIEKIKKVIILRHCMLRNNGLWEMIHISLLGTMWENPCVWNSKSCQLHVDFTFLILCWLCKLRNSMLDNIFFVKRCCSKLTSLCHNISLFKFKEAANLIVIEAKIIFTYSIKTWTLH